MIAKIISHYQILDEIGRGGMGVVYKGRDLRLDRLVALKFLPSSLANDAGAKARLMNEAKAASALEHPNICAVHEIGETDDGQLFITMPHYKGETLDQKLKRGQLSMKEAATIAVQTLQGLAEAHTAGIIHRDIKPANIFLTDGGQVKILDFGVARKQGSVGMTRTRAAIGTLAYMSPEQLRGDQVDHRTDIWSLSVVLYQMLAGVLPFQADYEQAMLYMLLHEPPKPLPAIRSDVPLALDRLIRKGMAKTPAERYKTSREMAIELEPYREKAGAVQFTSSNDEILPKMVGNILLVEDEPDLANGLSYVFRQNGYAVEVVRNGKTAVDAAETHRPDLIVLDVMLPGMDGFEVCRQLRKRGISVPVVMLTARAEEVDRVVGLEVGADDYVTKPFSTRELLARVKAHLRRAMEKV